MYSFNSFQLLNHYSLHLWMDSVLKAAYDMYILMEFSLSYEEKTLKEICVQVTRVETLLTVTQQILLLNLDRCFILS